MTSVKDIMTEEVVTSDSAATVQDVAKLMKDKGLGCIVVLTEGEPAGIVTERDLARRVIAEGLPYSTQVKAVMSKPLITVNRDASIREAARIMILNKIRRLVVTEDDKTVGIVVASDFLRQLSKKTLTEQILEALARYPPAFPYQE